MSQNSNSSNGAVVLTIHDPTNKKLKKSVSVDNHEDMQNLIQSLVQLQKDFVKVVEDVNDVKSLCSSQCCKNGLSLSCIFSCLKKQATEAIEQTPERSLPPRGNTDNKNKQKTTD